MTSVNLGRLIMAAHTDIYAPQGTASFPDDVNPVQEALENVGLLNPNDPSWGRGCFGTMTVAAYKHWQEICGYTGADADGIPGISSLTSLGIRTGLFTVGTASLQRDILMSKARSYFGIHETGDNITQFGAQYGENGVAWCQIFVWCVFQNAGLGDLYIPGKVDNCGTAIHAWENAGRFSEYPALGAQIVFGPGGGEHTGIVLSYTNTSVTSIEGNWNNEVSINTRPRTSSYVYGYGYPRFEEGIVSADPSWTGQ